MRRGLLLIVAVAVVGSLGISSALAGPGCGNQKPGDMAKMTASDEMMCIPGTFPSMVMMVGDKTYDSLKDAEMAAKAQDGKVVYVVGKDKFEDMNKAAEALACAAECYVNRFVSIGCTVDGNIVYCCADTNSQRQAVCPVTGKTVSQEKGRCGVNDAAAKKDGMGACQKACFKDGKIVTADGKTCDPAKCAPFVVAGQTYKTWQEAEKAHKAAVKAAEHIKLTYLVDGQKVNDAEKVCPKAKAAGKVQFVVNKDNKPCDETSCEMNARFLMAKAQYESARDVVIEKSAKL